ncbi:hypothetical protein G432_05080 [Sphingomonas sp. MM-1]|uniref:ClpX C4-type zinc finger protein n=1 Tax=Sphingomonas sp. MM-1 TaxID=745310 RepID=UPI0002C06436|nr:ClpX C4-type zinc finger protein [Sphingomonas sp. MM-1]AGH48743.1 hypothetical protein G432_05080 [Sphingomonas sp. MM-1]
MVDELNCSFCGKSNEEVAHLIAGTNALSVDACAKIVADGTSREAAAAATASNQRLECLRLAMSRDFIDPVAVAREFYKFVQSGTPAPKGAGDA